MADSKIKLTKADRFKAFLRSYFLLASFNYERMQNGGWCYSIIPAIKKLYKDPQDRADAFKSQEVPHLHIHVLGGPQPWKRRS